MSGWPSLDPLDDRRLAESLTAGDIDALAQVFDGYAARLFDYGHALLRDQQAATDALHDSLLAAFEHVGKLREQERFRSWLYALVRNECMRRLRSPDRPTERHEAPEVEDVFLDAEERARQQESRQLVHSALSGLTGRQREALDLLLRHDLAPQEIAGVLAMTVQEATDLAGQARGELDGALAAAVIARTGRDDCPSVAALVETWEWPLTPVACRRLIRHIETCPTCGERRRRRVSTPRLLQVLPVALMPPDLRGWVLSAATRPEYAEQVAAAARHAEPFDPWGWPEPVEMPSRNAGRKRRDLPRLWPAAAAAAAVIVVVSAAFVWLPGSPSKGTGSASSPSAPAPGSSDPVVSPTESQTPTESPSSASPTLTTPSETPTATRTPKRRPTSSRPTRSRPAPEGPPKPGRLAVSGSCTGLPPGGSCSVGVRAVGGTVRWSAGGSGGVSAGGGGTLGPGGSATVSATAGSACGDDGRGAGAVVFSPNGSVGVTWTCT